MGCFIIVIWMEGRMHLHGLLLKREEAMAVSLRRRRPALGFNGEGLLAVTVFGEPNLSCALV